jgi:hypothetical protein
LLRLLLLFSLPGFFFLSFAAFHSLPFLFISQIFVMFLPTFYYFSQFFLFCPSFDLSRPRIICSGPTQRERNHFDDVKLIISPNRGSQNRLDTN